MIEKLEKNEYGKFNYSQSYSSFSEFLDYAKNGKPSTRKGRGSRLSKGWGAVDNFEEAVEIAEKGWEEGAKKADSFSYKMVKDISQQIPRQEFIHDVEGTGIDVARYVENEPECFTRFENQLTRAGKLIHVVFNCVASGGTDEMEIIAKGAVACSLVELLEFSGYRVKVTIVEKSSRGLTKTSIIIPVKDYSQPLDKSKMAYALAHPSMLRRLIFSVEECAPAEIVNEMGFSYGNGYGSVDNLTDDEKNKMNCDIYFSSYSSSFLDSGKAEKFIIEKLKAQGIIFKKLSPVIH